LFCLYVCVCVSYFLNMTNVLIQQNHSFRKKTYNLVTLIGLFYDWLNLLNIGIKFLPYGKEIDWLKIV
jgi:hypothetical protein